MITIASAGCNVLDYIIEGARVTAVDFNACQVSPPPMIIYVADYRIFHTSSVQAESLGGTRQLLLSFDGLTFVCPCWVAHGLSSVQIALTELKATAIKLLDHDQFFAIFAKNDIPLLRYVCLLVVRFFVRPDLVECHCLSSVRRLGSPSVLLPNP